MTRDSVSDFILRSMRMWPENKVFPGTIIYLHSYIVIKFISIVESFLLEGGQIVVHEIPISCFPLLSDKR